MVPALQACICGSMHVRCTACMYLGLPLSARITCALWPYQGHALHGPTGCACMQCPMDHVCADALSHIGARLRLGMRVIAAHCALCPDLELAAKSQCVHMPHGVGQCACKQGQPVKCSQQGQCACKQGQPGPVSEANSAQSVQRMA